MEPKNTEELDEKGCLAQGTGSIWQQCIDYPYVFATEEKKAIRV